MVRRWPENDRNINNPVLNGWDNSLTNVVTII